MIIQPIHVIKLLHFDIVDGCQLRCRGCPNSGLIRKPSFIHPDLFRKCIANLDVNRIEIMRLFSFGEPLLHPDLETIGAILRDEAHFQINFVELSTNAQSAAYSRLENLIHIGILQCLAISCDGDGTKENYENLRPPAKWQKLLEFFEFTQQLMQKYPTLQVIARSIIQTPDDAKRWREILAPFGINSEFRGWKYLPESKDNLTGRVVKMGKGVCFHVAETDRLFVNYLGEVVPCCIHPKAGILGNLRETTYNTMLKDIKRQAFIDTMTHNRASMPVCNVCEFGPMDDPGPSAGQALGFIVSSDSRC